MTDSTPTCAVCGGSLGGKRSHAIYCGAKCRGMAYRGEAVSQRFCAHCDEPITGRRSDARYCAPLCKSRAGG